VLTLSNLGVVHYDRGEWRDAQRMFLQAFKIHPNCESCNNVASTLFLDGKYKQAAAYFEMALTPEYCDSTGHLPWGNLASALYWIDDQRPRALQLYRHAILLAEKDLAATPDSPKLIGKLVDYYAMTGDSTRALEMIERAKPYLEKDDDMMYKVGSACEKIGRRSAAMKHLTKRRASWICASAHSGRSDLERSGGQSGLPGNDPHRSGRRRGKCDQEQQLIPAPSSRRIHLYPPRQGGAL
jgi:tetratricopeptide (TPR) repeat protein